MVSSLMSSGLVCVEGGSDGCEDEADGSGCVVGDVVVVGTSGGALEMAEEAPGSSGGGGAKRTFFGMSKDRFKSDCLCFVASCRGEGSESKRGWLLDIAEGRFGIGAVSGCAGKFVVVAAPGGAGGAGGCWSSFSTTMLSSMVVSGVGRKSCRATFCGGEFVGGSVCQGGC